MASNTKRGGESKAKRTSKAIAAAARANGKKGGRPKALSEAQYDQVLEGIQDGLSLRKACDLPGSPAVKTILKRVTSEPEGFGQRYAQARAVQLLQMEEEMLHLADVEEAPGSDPKLANAAVQRARLQVETRKWLMSKLRPDKYGDRVALTGESGGAPIKLSNEDAAREVAMLLATAAARKVTAEREAQTLAVELPAERNGSTPTP